MKKKWKKKIKRLEYEVDFLNCTDDDILNWQNGLRDRIVRLELDGSDLDSELVEEPPLNSIIIDGDALSWQRFRAGWYVNSWDFSSEAGSPSWSSGRPYHGGNPKDWNYMMEKCRPMQLIISGEKVWTSMDREQFGGKNRD